MAESPEGVQSMDGGRSLRLFDWFLLPLLSLCNCRRTEANCAQVVNNGTVQSSTIDEQPVHGPSTYRDIEEIVSGNCSDDEASIRSQSFDTTGSSSSNQLKLSDLPLLALLTICAHLRPDEDRLFCKDLFNFRNTCRTFAFAVNSFFEKPSNMPMIEDLEFEFHSTDNKIRLYSRLPTVNYLMHPLSANPGVFKPSFGHAAFRRALSVHAYFDVDNDEAMDLAAESLCGRVSYPLEVSRFNATSDINKVFNLTRNVIFTKMVFRSNIFYKENGFQILAYLREHSNVEEVIIACDKFETLDAPEFLTQLYSATKCISLMCLDWNRRYSTYHDLSNAFWQQFLLQKLYEGAEVRYNDKPFTAQTNFTDPHERLWRFDLSKC